MMGISGTEFIVLLAVAAVVLGPERLPRYTQQLARLVRQLRAMALGASEQARAELGPEFENIDWQKLDPRQYDPRRIVREALAETFDPDDPLGMKSVSQDLRASADDVGHSITGTVQDAKQSLKPPSRGAPRTVNSATASVTGEAGDSAAGAGSTSAPAWDPDTL